MKHSIVALLMALFAVSASGQQNDDRKAAREREQARRLQSQIQKVEGEKAQLQQQITDLQKQTGELDKKVKANGALQRQLGDAKNREAAREKEVRDLKDAIAKWQAQSEDQKKRIAELQLQLADAAGEAKRVAGELKDAQGQIVQQREILARQAKTIVDSNDKNLKLYRLNVELLDKYNKKGVWDAMLQQEPVTQLKDVRMQALVQEYRDKLEEFRVEKPDLAK